MTCYKVNIEHVAYEIIDKEVMIIHLDNGNYFNLEGISVDIWNAIVAEISLDNLVESLNNIFHVENHLISASIHDFIQQLKSEELILESNPSPTEQTISFNLENTQTTFTPPTLKKYEDMQDLLLLDPLHDVDENVGWPNVKAQD